MEPDQFSSLTQDEDGWGDGVYGHNVTLMVDGQTGHDIDEPDRDGVTEMSVGVENLHPRPLAPSVADHEVAVVSNDGHLPRVPQTPLSLALLAERVFESALFIENLQGNEK